MGDADIARLAGWLRFLRLLCWQQVLWYKSGKCCVLWLTWQVLGPSSGCEDELAFYLWFGVQPSGIDVNEGPIGGLDLPRFVQLLLSWRRELRQA